MYLYVNLGNSGSRGPCGLGKRPGVRACVLLQPTGYEDGSSEIHQFASAMSRSLRRWDVVDEDENENAFSRISCFVRPEFDIRNVDLGVLSNAPNTT